MDAPPQELQDPREPDYAELAAEVPEPPPDAQEPPVEPVKRKRGRPLGSRNKPKPPPEDPEPPEVEPPEVPEVPEPSESSESEPATPIKPKPRARPRAKPKQIPVLDADFQPGYGGSGPPKPVRMRRQTTASTLMELIAGAAAQRGEQDRDRRRAFYETYLPL